MSFNTSLEVIWKNSLTPPEQRRRQRQRQQGSNESSPAQQQRGFSEEEKEERNLSQFSLPSLPPPHTIEDDPHTGRTHTYYAAHEEPHTLTYYATTESESPFDPNAPKYYDSENSWDQLFSDCSSSSAGSIRDMLPPIDWLSSSSDDDQKPTDINQPLLSDDDDESLPSLSSSPQRHGQQSDDDDDDNNDDESFLSLSSSLSPPPHRQQPSLIPSPESVVVVSSPPLDVYGNIQAAQPRNWADVRRENEEEDFDMDLYFKELLFG